MTGPKRLMHSIRNILSGPLGGIAPFKTRGGRRGRRREQLKLIAESPLFDARWYLETYTDVAAAGVNPALHFLSTGWLEGRDPGPDFATSAYLKANTDVARAGFNPLVHFIEFGQSEGREVRGHPFAPWKRTAIVHHFDAAAPVFRGKPVHEPTAPWRACYRLSQQDERLFTAGRWAVGYAPDPDRHALLEAAFTRLRRLSGFAEGHCELEFEGNAGSAELIDAWYVTDRLLRTRWKDGTYPFVVRGFQHDWTQDGELALVAEAYVVSPLDFVDLSLNDPYSPVQLVFADPDGDVLGTCLLAFPSLCRGGIHYAELLALAPEGKAPNPVAAGLAEATRILAARDRITGIPQCISVDVEGADGQSPLFQPEFRAWLERIAKVDVRPLPGSRGSAADLLGTAGSDWWREESLQGLVLGSDMVPTICSLASCTGSDDADELRFVPLLIAEPDPSQPVALVNLPADSPASVSAGASGYPAPWPRSSVDGGRDSRPAAIRLAAARGLADAELLVPAMDDALPFPGGETGSITWLFAAAEWNPAEFIEASRALSLQEGSPGPSIGFIGEPDAEVWEAAARLFRGRVRTYSSLAMAVRSAESDFVGYFGPGVILHDGRSAAAMVSLLRDPQVASASCALVVADRRGKSWHVAAVDGGKIRAVGELHRSAIQPQQLWRSTYPVVRPPRDLWLARAAIAKRWFRSDQAGELQQGVHLCTSLVSASYSGQRRRRTSAAPIPATPAARATSARILFG